MDHRVHFAIDRGGTFTDVYAECEGRDPLILKLLTQCDSYPDAAREGIRRALETITGKSYPKDKLLDTSRIGSVRIGTTIATNALLERKGARTALLISSGLGDLLQIGDQSRPDIFQLNIEHPKLLYEIVEEIEERVRLVPSEEVVTGKLYATGITQEKVEILQAPDPIKVRKQLASLKQAGISSIAVVLMHSYTYPAHEILIGEIAKELHFEHISLSSGVLPMVKIVPRGFTACADAYLTPFIKEWARRFCSGFDDELNVTFMQSDGGLAKLSDFTGSSAILSGPAGGVIGYSRSICEVYSDQKDISIIGFDMGGTSTDVSRYQHQLEHRFENRTAGVTIFAPQLDINTVSAGGGSILKVVSGILHVGPESAGADPGPACYGKGGPLTVTDANLILGRIIPETFPHVFGKGSHEPLNMSAAIEQFRALIDAHSDVFHAMSIYEVAYGFIRIANEAMTRPIRTLTEARGYDASKHILACFGGAAGQHCCAIARALSIKNIFIHRYSAILSAYGIALADVVYEKLEPCARPLLEGTATDSCFSERLRALSDEVRLHLIETGFSPNCIELEHYLNLRFEGSNQAMMIRSGQLDFQTQFVQAYERQYGFTLQRKVIVDDIRVRGIAKRERPPRQEIQKCTDRSRHDMEPDFYAKCFFERGNRTSTRTQIFEVETPVYLLDKLLAGQEINGPAVIVDTNSTIVVDPQCCAIITAWGDVEVHVESERPAHSSTVVCDPILLSIFQHRFMGIAEQMGVSLQRTAISTNIKERLDYSCAIFCPGGGLVANAPHLPVHLGAMQYAVKYQLESNKDRLCPGDVIMSNHPMAGGSHLPDITLITPVFLHPDEQPIFFLANRGHHSDIGGITPGSMPPFSKALYEEGAAIKSLKVVTNGIFNEIAVATVLRGSRNLNDCMNDIKAQIAANNKGRILIENLIAEYGLDMVHAYMNFIQENADLAIRQMLIDLSNEQRLPVIGSVSAIDFMDDGSPISLKITIDREDGSAVFDFSGTGSQVYGNWNAPEAITYSAVIYCLRCLVNRDIPLNQGCLRPIKVIIPSGSLLSPSEEAAVVGGNVLTSQRITDVIFLAFSACAASQGCMNNLTFGEEGKFGYYETIAGGAGAGPNWEGRSGVHTHMTNTRITDPEVLERRYPVLLRKFIIRQGSGGMGTFNGGNGVIREIQFLRPLVVSILSERRSFAPYGLQGGEPGKRGRNEIVRNRDGRTIHLSSKDSYLTEPGDKIRILTPGGGGFGSL